MAVPDQSLDPKILHSAKEEFLSKGYASASLRDICRNAGVTTGALYKRFRGKDALFKAVLAPTLRDVKELSEITEQQDYALLESNKLSFMWVDPEKKLRKIMDFLYERRDCFTMLLCGAQGSSYSDFADDFIDENTKMTMILLKTAFQKGLIEKILEEDELHMLLTAYWSMVFEPIRHAFSKKKALQHCEMIAKFFNWKAVIAF